MTEVSTCSCFGNAYVIGVLKLRKMSEKTENNWKGEHATRGIVLLFQTWCDHYREPVVASSDQRATANGKARAILGQIPGVIIERGT